MHLHPRLLLVAACHPLLVTRPPPSMSLLEDAFDGDISAVLESMAIAGSAAASMRAAWVLAQRDGSEDVAAEESIAELNEPDSKMAMSIDLGDDGEPKGVNRFLFTPLLPRSSFLLLELRVPLGLLIEEQGATIAVTGALPGYSAIQQVEPR